MVKSLYIVLIFISSTLSSSSQTSKRNITKDYFDSRGELLVKLYKKINNSSTYWETWNTDGLNAIVHWGTIGFKGNVLFIKTKTHNNLKDSLNSQITDKLKEGFSQIPFEKQFTLAITFKLKTWGTPEYLTKREEYRNIITEHLRWTGNGRCDDGDIGSGEMTLYAEVIDPYLAIKTIPQEFKLKKITANYYFTISQGDKILKEKILPSPN